MSAPKRVITSFTLDPFVRDALRERARAQYLSSSRYLEIVLRRDLEEKKAATEGETRRAAADVGEERHGQNIAAE